MKTCCGSKGLSLIEVLISMAILLAGIVSILNLFPISLKANNEAAFLTEAALLGQLKAEEVRRDSDALRTLINEVRLLTTPTNAVQFAQNSRLTYSFCGVSVMDAIDDPDDPRDDVGVARIIVRYHKSYRKSEQVIYELRFDQ